MAKVARKFESDYLGSTNYYIFNAVMTKQSGYVRAPEEYINGIVKYVCGTKYKRTQTRITKLISQHRLAKNGFLSLRSLTLLSDKVQVSSNYVRTDNSPVLRLLYDRAKYDDNCKELLLQLVMLDVLDISEFARNMTDLRYVLNTVCMYTGKYESGLESIIPVELCGCQYLRLLAAYACSASNGIDVGFSAYDIVYNLYLQYKNFNYLPVAGSRNTKNNTNFCGIAEAEVYEYTRNELRQAGTIGVSGFSFDADVIKKYEIEFGIILPLIISKIQNESDRIKVLEYISRISMSSVALFTSIITDVQFLIGTGFDGSSYEVTSFDGEF